VLSTKGEEGLCGFPLKGVSITEERKQSCEQHLGVRGGYCHDTPSLPLR